MTHSASPIAPNNFDRSKPFYPLVIHYVCLLFGFKELAARGVAHLLKNMLEQGGPAQHREAEEHWRRLTGEALSKPVQETMARLTEPGSLELMPPLELATRTQSGPIQVEAAEIAEDVAINGTYLSGTLMRAAGSLLIVAWESTEEHHDKGELWEFLRHCRNAAAHNGRFHLLAKEPRHPAKWASLSIAAGLHGTPLFHSEAVPGFLGPGDVIRLLWDIEQAYPNMAVAA